MAGYGSHANATPTYKKGAIYRAGFYYRALSFAQRHLLIDLTELGCERELHRYGRRGPREGPRWLADGMREAHAARGGPSSHCGDAGGRGRAGGRWSSGGNELRERRSGG